MTVRAAALLLAVASAASGCGADDAPRAATPEATTQRPSTTATTAPRFDPQPRTVTAQIMRVRPSREPGVARLIVATGGSDELRFAHVRRQGGTVRLTLFARRPGVAVRSLAYPCVRVRLPAHERIVDGATGKPPRRGKLARAFDLRGPFPPDAECPPLEVR